MINEIEDLNRVYVPYQYREFPRALHKAGGLSLIVTDEDQKATALAAGWALQPVLDVAPVDPEPEQPARKRK